MTLFSTHAPVDAAHDDLDRAVTALIREALEHPAAQHPLLLRFARGAFADQDAALRQYAVDYAGFASWWPHHLDLVASRLPPGRAHTLLQQHLAREQGRLDDREQQRLRAAGIDPRLVLDVPQSTLFRRFCHALGIQDSELATPTPAGRQWRTRLMQFLGPATATQAIGAIVLGSALLARPTHRPLLQGMLALGTLHRSEMLFFELQCASDRAHRDDLLSIVRELATACGGIDELRAGMDAALQLRCEFLDHIYAGLMGSRLANLA